MFHELLIDAPIDTVLGDWDFLEDRVIKRFSTFRQAGQNIYGVRQRHVGEQIVDPRKGVLESIELASSGIVSWNPSPFTINVTVGGTPHRVRHNFGYWHINDMDELYVSLPPESPGELGHFIVLMQTPHRNEGESFAWYCTRCLTMLHEFRYATGRDGFDGFWRAEAAAVHQYNAEELSRRCPECGFENPMAYCWNPSKDTPEEAASRELW